MQAGELPRILLLGRSGQLGRALLQSLPDSGHMEAHGRDTCDLLDEQEIRGIVRNSGADFVVNAAAYTQVDAAESEREACFAINARAPEILAQEAAAIGARFIHYSTDYVFDGKKNAPYHETDRPNPLNAYGESKLMGENAALAENPHTAIFRLSWVYGFSDRNFPMTILRLAQQRDEIQVVCDQVGTPTFTEFVADVTRTYIDRICTRAPHNAYGLFHLAPRGFTSRHDYAVLVVRAAQKSGLRLRLNDDRIVPVMSHSYESKANRPMNTVFDTKKLAETFDIRFPMWDRDLNRFLEKFLDAKKSGCPISESPISGSPT